MNNKEKLIEIIKSLDDSKIDLLFNELNPNDKNKEMSDFLFATINGCKMKMTGEKEITYYNSNNVWIIQQDYKNGNLWIRYSLIWEVFEKKYKLNYEQIRDFISSWVETNLNWKGFTPVRLQIEAFLRVETNLNWRGLTPKKCFDFNGLTENTILIGCCPLYNSYKKQ